MPNVLDSYKLVQSTSTASAPLIGNANEYHTAMVEDASEQEGVTDFFMQGGLVSAVVSGGVSLWNTGAELATYLGADDYTVQTEDVLGTVMDEDGVSYYKRHKDGIDALGFMATSLVPGLGAIKGLKIAQAGLRATQVSTRTMLATGIRSALVPAEKAAAMRTAILEGGGMNAVKRTQLFKEAFHQQTLEAAAYEGAVLLTMNQNPTINKEGLDYFDAIADNATSAAGFALIGGAIGGSIEGVIKYSGLKKLVTSEELAANAKYKIYDAGEGSYNAGDPALLEYKRYTELSKMAKDSPDNAKAVAAADKQKKVVLEKLASAMGGNYKDENSIKAANGLFNLFEREDVGMDAAVRAMSGVQSYRTVGAVEAAGNVNSKDHVLFTEDTGYLDVMSKYYRGLRELLDGKQPKYTGGKSQLNNTRERMLASGTKGTAFPQDDSIKGAIADKFSDHPAIEDIKDWLNSTVGKSYSSISLAKKIHAKFGLPELTMDDITFTVMHELGHLHTNKPSQGVISYLATKGNKNAEKLLEQMERVSRTIPSRKNNWDNIDKLKAMAEADPTNAKVAESLAKAEKYMKDSHELLADTWEEISRIMVDNDKAGRLFLKNNAPDILRLMQFGSKHLGIKNMTDRLLPGRRRLLNVETAELVDTGIAPTIADVGNVTAKFMKNHKYVSWGQEGTALAGHVTGDTAFNPKVMSAQEANALYYLRMKDPTPVNYAVAIDGNDLPRLTRAIHDMTNNNTQKVTIKAGESSKTYTSVADLRRDVALRKDELLNELRGASVEAKLGGSHTYRELARVLDVDDRIAYKGISSAFDEETVAKYNFFHSLDRDIDAPTHIALMFGKNAVNKRGFLVQGLAQSQQRIQAQKELMRNHIDSYVGEEFSKQLPSTVKAGGNFNAADRYTTADTSSGMLKSGNEELLGGWATYLGKWVSRVTAKKHEEVKTAIAPHVASIVNDVEAKAHVAALDSLLRQRFYNFLVTDTKNIPENAMEFGQTVMNDISSTLLAGAGEVTEDVMLNLANQLQNTKLVGFMERMKSPANVIVAKQEYAASIERAAYAFSQGDYAGTVKYLDEIVDNHYLHEISNNKVTNFHRQYVALNDELVRNRRNLHQFTGRSVGGLLEGRLYPGQYNTKDLPFFKFVISANEKGISNDKHVGIISGRTADELAQIEKEVKATYGDDVKIITKTKEEVEHYKQLEAEYNSQLAIDENSMNSELHRKGRAWNVAPVPSERMVENYVNNLLKGHTTLTREMTAAHFGEEVATLKNAAAEFETYNRATYGAKTNLLGKRANLWKDIGIGNPFSDKIRQMLNINNLQEYKTWYNLQQTVADKFNEMAAEVKHTFKMFNEDMVDPARMNQVMEEYGLKPAFNEDVTDYVYANTKIPKQTLEKAVAKVNGFIATTMLRMDGAQALTDIMSTAITTAPELKKLASDLSNNALQDLLHVNIPNVGGKLPTPAKLMFQAQKDFFTAKGRTLLKEYQDFGILGGEAKDYLDSIDAMAKVFDINGAKANPEGYKKILHDLGTHAKAGLTWANDRGVEWSKFISARSADLMVEAAGIVDQDLRRTILNTFVNRTHGNYLASQRPALFQGWGGQLIGLFQTYQFNLIQQFARHLGEDKAAALAMVGIQGGVFGAQSLPGFQALNEFILEKNRGEGDLYTGTSRLLGNEAAEWLLYGLGSQITTPVTGSGISLYSRGNLTPRSPILIPTRIEDIPAFRFTTDVIGNIANTVGKIAQSDSTGQAAQAFWEGVAHNGLNRPLQGLGQLIAGGRTTTKGSLIMAYNEVNAGLILAKALGVNELNEAVATDAFYRREAYNSARNSKLASLGEEFKTAVRSGEATGEATKSFMRRYTESGGSIQNFGKWMRGQMLGATQSQLTEARASLSSSDGLYMQSIMGASIPEGFNVPKAEPTMSVDINSMFQ